MTQEQMTIEQKAQRYDEAIKIAREINNEQRAQPFNVMTRVFPELKESEGGRIKEELILYLKGISFTTIERAEQVRNWIAWLEKQGEQKPAKQPNSYELEEEIEEWLGCEAFPEGTNITPLPKAMEIVRETANHFYDFGRKQQAIRNIQCTNSQVITPESYINEDQKKGIQIVLDNPQEYGLQKSADKTEPKFNFKVGQWIVSNDKKVAFLIESKSFGYFTFEDINGNIYTKCLPPTEDDYHLWTIQDAKDGDVLAFKDGTSGILLYKECTENFGVLSYCRIVRNSFIDKEESGWGLTLLSPATKEQRDALMKAMTDAGYEWDANKKELKMIEKKPAEWNKQQVVNALTSMLTEKIKPLTKKISDGTISDREEMFRTALIEIRSFVNSPSFQIGKDVSVVWSKEDEKYLSYAIHAVEDMLGSNGKNTVSWLKSLKDRYTWKPTEKQIMALKWALNRVPYDSYTEELHGLLEQLKQLNYDTDKT